MTNFLLDEPPLIVLPSLAKLIGLNEAIFLQQINYWIKKNEREKRNFKEGRYWTYNTFEEWQKDTFPFWSTRTIKRVVTSLKSSGLLLSDNELGDDKWDRTNWYTIDYERLNVLSQCIVTICHNAKGQFVTIDSAIMSQSYTEITSEKNSDINTSSENPDEPLLVALLDICQLNKSLLTNSHLTACECIIDKIRKTYTHMDGNQVLTCVKGFGIYWKENDWRGQKGQCPTPAIVLTEWQKYANWCKEFNGGNPPGV